MATKNTDFDELSQRCSSESTLCDESAICCGIGGELNDLVNRDSCETITLRSTSSGISVQQIVRDKESIEDLEDNVLLTDALGLRASGIDVTLPYTRETDDSSPLSLSHTSDGSSSPSDAREDQDSSDVMQHAKILSPSSDYERPSPSAACDRLSAKPSPATESVAIRDAKMSGITTFMMTFNFLHRVQHGSLDNKTCPDKCMFLYKILLKFSIMVQHLILTELLQHDRPSRS